MYNNSIVIYTFEIAVQVIGAEAFGKHINDIVRCTAGIRVVHHVA